MSTKYSDIMNTSGLNGKLLRMDVELHEKLYNLEASVTEKIHGENFRVGIDGKGEFIGQRNNHFREFEKHPNWNKFSDKAKNEINVIHAYIRELKKLPKYKIKNITFFGELYGKGMQSGFDWDFDDGLRVLWFDIKTNESYMDLSDITGTFHTLELSSVPWIGNMTIKEALDLDIDSFKSQVSLSDFIEGVVITPLEIPDWWRFPGRLILKYKTKKYAEEKQGKHKKERPINNFVSKYVDFVTEARIDHAIQGLKERKVQIIYEMSDLQHIPKAVIADIEKEENDGQPLAKEDRKYLGSYIPKFYKQYLVDLVKNMQIELNRERDRHK